MTPKFEAWVEKARSVPIASIAPRGLKRHGKELVGPCPRCGGTDRFSVNTEERVFNCRGCDKGGDVIELEVFLKGCDFKAAVAKLTAEPEPNGTSTAWVTEGEWIYRDADGQPYLRVVRKRTPDGKKVYPQYHLKNGTWAKGKPPGPKIPYRLPELLDADRTEPVFIVEGEKCADRLAREGMAATSASEGAGKWTKDLDKHFAGRIVWIIPDGDEPGRKHADEVAAHLYSTAQEVRIVKIPGLGEGEDVFDFLEAGRNGDDLRQLGERAPMWTPTQTNGASDQPGDPGPSPDSQIILIEPPQSWWRDPATIPPRRSLFGGHYIRRAVGVTIGAGGRAKTTLGCCEAVGMAVGRNLMTGEPLPDGPLRVWMLNGEEDQDELDRRAAAVCQLYEITEADLGSRLFVQSVRDKPMRIATIKGVATLDANVVQQMTAFAKDNRIDVLMVDPLVSFHSVPENDNGAMDLVIKGGFGAIANQANAAVELFHHPGKPKPGQVETVVEDGRGASSVLWAVRSARVLNFMTPDEAAKLGIAEDERRMHVRIANGKANMGPLGKAEWMRLKVEKLVNGDMVVVASHWTPQNPFENVTSAHMELARRLAATGDYRADSRSPKWLGYAIAQSLGVPVSFRADNEPKDLARLHAIIKIWLKNKALDVESRKDGDGKDRQFIVSGPFKPEAQAVGQSTVYADDEFSIQ